MESFGPSLEPIQLPIDLQTVTELLIYIRSVNVVYVHPINPMYTWEIFMCMHNVIQSRQASASVKCQPGPNNKNQRAADMGKNEVFVANAD